MVVLIDSSTDTSVEFGAIREILNILWAVFAGTIKFSRICWGSVRRVRNSLS